MSSTVFSAPQGTNDDAEARRHLPSFGHNDSVRFIGLILIPPTAVDLIAFELNFFLVVTFFSTVVGRLFCLVVGRVLVAGRILSAGRTTGADSLWNADASFFSVGTVGAVVLRTVVVYILGLFPFAIAIVGITLFLFGVVRVLGGGLSPAATGLVLALVDLPSSTVLPLTFEAHGVIFFGMDDVVLWTVAGFLGSTDPTLVFFF